MGNRAADEDPLGHGDRGTHRLEAKSSPPRRRRRWRVAMAGAVAIILGGTCFVAIRYVLREHPGPESLSVATKTFKGGASISTGRKLTYEPPAEGVYTLKGQGTESISFPPSSQHDGAVMPASVTYLTNGCWQWHVDYNVAHWEEYDFCPDATQLLLAADRNSQSWDFGAVTVNNLARFTCPPATVVLPEDPKAAQALSWSCTGSNTAVHGRSTAATTARIDGTVPLRIRGSVVPTVHELQRIMLRGGQRGTIIENWWFTAGSGLPVRMDRRITIKTSSPIGTVTYHEAGSWQISSLQPRT